jgi:hypothetical protein
MAKRNQTRPKSLILHEGGISIGIILDSNGIQGDLSAASTIAIVWSF